MCPSESQNVTLFNINSGSYILEKESVSSLAKQNNCTFSISDRTEYNSRTQRQAFHFFFFFIFKISRKQQACFYQCGHCAYKNCSGRSEIGISQM